MCSTCCIFDSGSGISMASALGSGGVRIGIESMVPCWSDLGWWKEPADSGFVLPDQGVLVLDVLHKVVKNFGERKEIGEGEWFDVGTREGKELSDDSMTSHRHRQGADQQQLLCKCWLAMEWQCHQPISNGPACGGERMIDGG